MMYHSLKRLTGWTLLAGRSGLKTGLALAILSLGLVAGAAGCSVRAPYPVKTFYVLRFAAPPAAAEESEALDRELQLASLVVAPPYDSLSLIYHLDEHRVEADYYHQFSAAPPRLLEAGLAAALQESGFFARGVVSRHPAASRAITLRVSVQRMFIDLHTSEKPQAVVAVHWRLGGERPIWERQMEDRQPLSASSPQAAVAGLSQVWSRMLAAVLPEMVAALRAAETSLEP